MVHRKVHTRLHEQESRRASFTALAVHYAGVVRQSKAVFVWAQGREGDSPQLYYQLASPPPLCPSAAALCTLLYSTYYAP